MIDQEALHQICEDFFGDMPHPAAPAVKVKDYAAVNRAAMIRKGSFANGQEVQAMHQELRAAQVSPAQFEYLWNIARPLANRLLGRDPEIMELSRFKDQDPAHIHDFYFNHPHPHHPEVKAGEMMRYYHAAYPVAKTLHDRPPVLREVARFAMAGYDEHDILSHYNGEFERSVVHS